MKIEFAKWGNSLAVRIPSALAKEIGAAEGRKAEMTVENGALVLRPAARARKRRRYTLDELLDGMTEAHVHPEIGTGPAVGNEFR